MTTLDSRPTSVPATTSLHRPALLRFGFAVVWALLLVVVGSTLSPPAVALLLLYPLVDLVAAVVDHRASRTSRPTPALYVNMALSLLAVVGLGVAVTSGLPAVLVVWGAWAVTTGIVQLVVAVTRRALGGQWPLIVSGGISTLAGTAFIASSGSPTASLTTLAGYAGLGGLFFLLSALRLRRRPARGR